MSLNRLFEKQKRTVFYCQFMAHKASEAGFLPSKAFNGQVRVSLVLWTVRNGMHRAQSTSPFYEGKRYQQCRVTSPIRNATGNKGGFLRKETQSASETASLLLNDLGLHSLPETVLASVCFINKTVCDIILLQTLQKSLAYSLIKSIYCSDHL